MNKIYDEKLTELSKIDNQKAIDFFVKSDLPNTFFLQHLILFPVPSPFWEKKYWTGFANVLIKRGIPKIDDVKIDLLIWFQDINWPGALDIAVFVQRNLLYFEESLKINIEKSLDMDDYAWYCTLLGVLMNNEQAKKYMEKFDKAYKNFTELGLSIAKEEIILLIENMMKDVQNC